MQDKSTERDTAPVPAKPLETLRNEDNDLYRAIRSAAFKRALKILKDPKVDIPPGQLLAFVAKMSDSIRASEVDEKPKIEKQTNVLAILPGLPPERAQQIISQFEKEIETAKKQLNPGGRS